jgi:hypothetical protein
MSLSPHPIIGQIQGLQKTSDNFWIELSSGRIAQVWHSKTGVATTGHIIGLLNDGGFELIQAEQVVSVGEGIHAEEQQR